MTKAYGKKDLAEFARFLGAGASPHLLRLVRHDMEASAEVGDRRLQNTLLKGLISRFVELERQVAALLNNTLPEPVIVETRAKGGYAPRTVECSILFTDLIGFTRMAAGRSPEALVAVLDDLFTGFDALIDAHGGTKIKTMGDAYMAVFGAPEPDGEHAVRAVEAGLALQRNITAFNAEHGERFAMRVGIHSGEVTAAVVGAHRMQYDVFGDAVNVAQRFETGGEAGRVNVSEAVVDRCAGRFVFEPRGLLPLKNRGELPAFFVRAAKENADDDDT